MQNKMKEYKLDNGLTVYFYQDLSKHSVIGLLGVKYGGLDTDFIMNGIHYHYPDGMAHLLEHYLCEQSKTGDLIKQFRQMHLFSNALTSFYSTQFYFSGVANIMDGLTCLIKGIHHPDFTEENLEQVKHAVREEILKKQDNMARRILEAKLDNLFQNIPMNNNIGTIESIDSITLADIKTCYQAFYHPKNEILLIAGNFDEDEMIEKIKELYRDCSFEPVDVAVYPYEEPITVKRKNSLIKMPTGNTGYELDFKISLENIPKDEYLNLESAIYNFFRMNFSASSKTCQELKRKNIIKTFIITDFMIIDSFCIIGIGAYTDKPEEFKKAIFEVLENPNYDEELLELSKKEAKMNLALRPEILSRMINPFLDNLFIYQYPHLDKIEDINQFTMKKMKELIGKLEFEHYTEISVIDLEKN